MKLDKDTIEYIQSAIRTAQMVGIDNVIIEPDCTRGMDDGKTVVICQNDNVPDMPFGSIGLNRLNTLTSRLDIAKTQENFSISLVVDDDEEFARSLTMTGKGIKIDYRCANPMNIEAPKKINDTFKYEFQINAEAVLLLQKSQTAMGAETVTIISNEKGVSFEMSDINGDVFAHTFSDGAVPTTEDSDVSFVNRYPIKTLLPLFKHDPENVVGISQKGIMKVIVNGLTIFVLPQV